MNIDTDAYKPAQIAALIESAGVAKARMAMGQMLTLAILAGAFIGLGAAAYIAVMTGADTTHGPTRLLGGLAFSLGLILVIVGGAELFTGNALMVMAAVDGKITLAELLRNWGVVYAGNFIGALGLAVAFAQTGLLEAAFGATAVQVAAAKVSLNPLEYIAKGALCNALVCLAVWLTFSARDTAGKILAILWPISSFVLLGLEHSVANMYLIPLGILAGAEISFGAAAGNLVWVTVGNVIGGAGGVALAYRYAYLGGKKV
ncbi:MAG TPA: formate/nitrite transporter family protein [Paracoccaceae bacterium]